jgi:hypothetical protein
LVLSRNIRGNAISGEIFFAEQLRGGIGLPFRQAQGPEHVEGLALAATRSRSLNCGILDDLIPKWRQPFA